MSLIAFWTYSVSSLLPSSLFLYSRSAIRVKGIALNLENESVGDGMGLRVFMD